MLQRRFARGSPKLVNGGGLGPIPYWFAGSNPAPASHSRRNIQSVDDNNYMVCMHGMCGKDYRDFIETDEELEEIIFKQSSDGSKLSMVVEESLSGSSFG